MNIMFDIFPYVGQVMLFAVLLTVTMDRFVTNTRLRIGFVFVLLALGLFIPVYGLSITQWLRSVEGDLSVLSLVIFVNILAQRLFNFTLVEPASRNKLLLGVVLIGLVFYPLALGVSAFDPYRLGYSPVLMSVLLCLISVVAWYKSLPALAIILLLPLVAFNMHMLESTNLWDYLLDPILLIYAVVQSTLSSQFSGFKLGGGSA